ncbi:MAG: formimidoylglutamase [Bacteroidota bacterium]
MNSNFRFVPATPKDLTSIIRKREGELKLGEEISIKPLEPEVEFVILGVKESIGAQANYGNAGAENGFHAFFQRFVNMQSNRFLSGKNIAFAGTIECNTSFSTIEQAREQVVQLDAIVQATVLPYFKAKKKVILIGGGHNNAYPLIKALHLATSKKIDIINLDPHCDCRALEGRHSGNSFSYAIEENLINRYHVLGLHKAYNSEFLLEFLDENNCFYSFFEDYLSEKRSLKMDLMELSQNIGQLPLGMELDLDAIKGMPSSAFTPSGFTLEEARNFICSIASKSNIHYFHLPEGAPRNENEELVVGKSLAMMVWDFIFHQQRSK